MDEGRSRKYTSGVPNEICARNATKIVAAYAHPTGAATRFDAEYLGLADAGSTGADTLLHLAHNPQMARCGIGFAGRRFLCRMLVTILGAGALATAWAQQPTLAPPTPPLRYGVFESMGYPFYVAGTASAPPTGLLIELGDAIARQLNMGLQAVPLPRRRVEPALVQGQIEMLCYFNPSWAEQPDKLAWSVAMLPQIERVVGPKGARMGSTPNWEFEGKRVALQLGYHYPVLQSLIDAGKAVRVDQSKVALQFRSLEIRMADLLVTSEGEIEGYFNDNPNARGDFEVSRTAFSVTPTHCAIGRTSRLSMADIDKAIARLQSSGDMERMAKRYGVSAR